ncbi:hypothetical protein Tco_0300017 [Tanacetum coccineum]
MFNKMNKANAQSSGTTWKENFVIRHKFPNIKMIKEMITRVAVEQRRELHLKKNDKKRLRCICRGKVPQFSCEDGDDVSGSKGVGSDGSKAKSQSKEKGQVGGSKGKLINKTKAGGGLKIRLPLKQYEVGISKNKVFRAKKMAQERVDSNHTRQYAHLERQYKRFYVCLGPLKDGFKAGKGDLLGLDGCFLSGRAHYDVLSNNMCEVLNRQLVDERDKPIITCLEFIREYLMKIIVNVHKVISKSHCPHTPNATKVFKKIMKDAGQIKLLPFGTWQVMEKKLAYHNLTVINPIGYQHGKICIEEISYAKLVRVLVTVSVRELGITSPNDPSAQATAQAQQSSQAPPATQASQTAPTTSAQTTHTTQQQR